MKYTIAALAVTTLVANAATVTVQEAAANFSHYFEGNDIYDSASVGTEWKNGWALGGTGSNLAVTTTGTDINAAWGAGGANWFEGINATNGTTTLGDGVVGRSDAHSFEMRFRMNDNDGTNNTFFMRMGQDTDRNDLTISETGITITKTGGGFETIAHDFTQFTVLRWVIDGSAGDLNLAHVWLDGVALTAGDGNPKTSSNNDSRFIIGDGTSGDAGDFVNLDIDYIAYDVDNAFAPVPEPSSASLLGLGGLALILRRRK